MSNFFIVNQKNRMIWADVECPVMPKSEKYYSCGTFAQEAFNSDMYHYDCNLEIYNTRPHYPYSTELNWMDGQRVLQGTDFEIKAEEIRKVKCHCPCHKNPGMVHIQACCQNGYRESRTPAIAIPLPSNSFETWPILSATILGDKEEKTYMMFTLEQVLQICDKVQKITMDNSSVSYDAVRDMEFVEFDYSYIEKVKAEYLKQTFNIDISNK